jgi:predicted dithiol-disulfide oxidoreductase (DUF899 family)
VEIVPTSFVGSVDIPTPDIEQRLAIAIVGRSPVARQMAFARERGGSHLRFYQTVADGFATDYRALVDGEEGAAVLMWQRRGDEVRLFWAAEGAAETADPGQDPHLAPDPTSLWTLLDWTAGGRGTNWYPKLEYGAADLRAIGGNMIIVGDVDGSSSSTRSNRSSCAVGEIQGGGDGVAGGGLPTIR